MAPTSISSNPRRAWMSAITCCGEASRARSSLSRRVRRHEQRCESQLAQQRRLRDAVPAAAEARRCERRWRDRIGRLERRPGLDDVDPAREVAAACPALERRHLGVAHPQPELALAGVEAEREHDAAGPQQRPLAVQAEQRDSPPERVRHPAQVDGVREPQRELGCAVQLGGGRDGPRDRRRPAGDRGRPEVDLGGHERARRVRRDARRRPATSFLRRRT